MLDLLQAAVDRVSGRTDHAEARHVRLADAAVEIGPPPAGKSYLVAAAILEAARSAGADAIHPGYGFLSERAGFAQLLAGRGYSDQELADRLTGQGITAVVRDGGSAVYGRYFPPFGGRPGPRPPRPRVDASAVAVSTEDGLLTATLPLTRGTLTLSADDGDIVHTVRQLRTVEWIAGAGLLLVTGLLLTRVVYWHGDINRDEVGRVLRDMRFVSETYGLVIPASMSRRALADLAILVSIWACSQRGVDGMFGSPGADPRPEAKPAKRKPPRK